MATLKNKIKFGEVRTDYSLVEEMLNLFPQEIFKNPNLKWLDPTCGQGNFMKVLFGRLYKSLETVISNPVERKVHIIEEMLYMVEINHEHIGSLRQFFGEKANIINMDFLDMHFGTFDVIIGNPPFNIRGMKKVPTNTKISKKKDGYTVWPDILRHALNLLRENGYLSFITPSLWMKPDKAGIYALLTQAPVPYYCCLKKIRCFTNTETNRLFHGKAQTPTCFFLVQKAQPKNVLSLYENSLKRYLPYQILTPGNPIPVFGASVFTKLQPFLLQVGHPTFIKTSMPSSKISLYPTPDVSFCNIRTCVLRGTQPELVLEYSKQPLPYFGKKKLVLAHKMYGFPVIDEKGIYGISRRDNYVLVDNNIHHLRKWRDFLSTKLALYLFEGTRYRMKYLEKYVFELIPDITKLEDFPEKITDDMMAEYFQFTEVERKAIASLHRKKYFKLQ